MKISRKDIQNLIREEYLNSKKNLIKIVIDEPIINLNESIDNNFEIIEDQNLLKESEIKLNEIKNINEEIKRMKQLVDFRSPLLSGENF